MIERAAMITAKMLAMGFSSRFVYEALKALVEEKGQGRIQYQEIAERAGCSSKTVYRAVAQLRADGCVKVYGSGKGYGYFYEVS
jgi:DNA-binding Lrp family transcriptional regulator